MLRLRGTVYLIRQKADGVAIERRVWSCDAGGETDFKLKAEHQGGAEPGLSYEFGPVGESWGFPATPRSTVW